MYFSSFDPLHLSLRGQNIRIVPIGGGFGNQVFQYIFARWLELNTGEPCWLDDFQFMEITYYNEQGYEMDKVFDLKQRLLTKYVTPAQKEEIFWHFKRRKENFPPYANQGVPDILLSMGYPMTLIGETSDFTFKGNVVFTPANQYNPQLAMAQGCIYYSGYFINPYYFRDIAVQMLQELSFVPLKDEKNKEYAKQMAETNSVAVHFRTRGAFAKEWHIPESSYAAAINSLEKWREENEGEEFTYFVFTDGPEYVREHYKEAGLEDKHIVFVEGNIGSDCYIDCQLMTLCKHRIVTNSSFDYLAALLRKDRTGAMVNLNPGRELV